jgi:hypothetical protein
VEIGHVRSQKRPSGSSLEMTGCHVGGASDQTSEHQVASFVLVGCMIGRDVGMSGHRRHVSGYHFYETQAQSTVGI